MARSERSGHTTTDHDFIRRWVEERGGWPARVVGTSRGNDAGLIRIDFPGFFRAYVEGSDDPDAALEDREDPLPSLKAGDTLSLRDLEKRVWDFVTGFAHDNNLIMLEYCQFAGGLV